jgi:dolichol-phosphate mannosyltransferase
MMDDGRPHLMPDTPCPEISVIIPFFNEAESAPHLLAELRVAMDALGASCEVLLMDDGSSDSTANVLHQAAAGWPAVRVFSFAQNQGQAAGLGFGFAHARGPICVTLDGDGQNDPADIAKLIAAVKQGADMAVGVRMNRQDSALRRRMSRLANRVRGWLLRDDVTDSGCALKALKREVAGSFLEIRTLYSFMPALAKAAGFSVVQVPVNHRPREKGVSNYGLGVMLWRPLLDMIGVWWFIRRRCADPSQIRMSQEGSRA